MTGSGGGPVNRNFLQKLRWRFKASSALISRSLRTISSFTASAQRPQIHCPLYRSRILSMYSSVHSSVKPQQAHLTISPSSHAAAAATTAAALTATDSAIIEVDIAVETKEL
ncbi:unnamed protein product [Cuscuta epithymum]|uniref:Uncharacterized protein n=1 Tax=Cuscuta epithymum TaxID=186058 RepID=A0AAV0F425_9ASTE|nr:unnamed protein product [Cuscuta epithymum]